ncbi:unnamed protein product [Schistosoma margrebowiei]|uniref:Uncharacterized protein n=1 Tax=Schistosoma margrebowiei TaxID=48269 RepID=A0A183L928_9TREM|nr:unnamed protein product [Schistosoma margrebowiei]
MKTSTSEGKHGIQWTSRMQLDDLDFEDGLALLSQTQQQMQEKTNSVAAASAAVGLNIHKGKSRILRYNTVCTNQITIDGEVLEDVKTFTYLGSIIDVHGGSDADVKARIGKARAAYLQLKNVWNSKQLSTNTKHGIQWIGCMRLDDLDFLDDLALLFRTPQQMQAMNNRPIDNDDDGDDDDDDVDGDGDYD